jgi:hypothetical protein
MKVRVYAIRPRLTARKILADSSRFAAALARFARGEGVRRLKRSNARRRSILRKKKAGFVVFKRASFD